MGEETDPSPRSPRPDRSGGGGAQRASAPAIVTSMSYMAGGQLIGQVVWFGSLIILGIILDPSAFGTVTAGLVIVSAAIPLLGAGSGGSLIATRRLAPGQIWSSVRLNLSIAVAFALVLILLADLIVDLFAAGGDPAVLRWLSLAIVFHALTIVPLTLLKKTMRFGRHTLVDVGAFTGAGTLAVLTAVLGGGVWSLVVRLVVYQVLLAGLAIYFARNLLFRSRAADLEETGGEARRGGPWFLLLALTQFAAQNADYIVVGRFTDAERLGIYSLAYTLAFAPLRQFSWQIGRVLFAAAADVDDEHRLRRQAAVALRLGAAFQLPFIVPLVLLAPVVLPAVLGQKWEPMVPAFQILVVAGIVHAVANLVGEFLSGAGHIDMRGKLSTAWAVAMIVLLVALVPRYGVVGAAIAHLVSSLPMAAAVVWLGGARLSLPTSDILWALTPAGAALLAQALIGGGLLVAFEASGATTDVAMIAAAVGALLVAAAVLTVGSEPPSRRLWSAVASTVRDRRLRTVPRP